MLWYPLLWPVNLPPPLPFCCVPPCTAGVGSGKSNLLEAICFAAGCSAATLRARTLKELASADAGGEVGMGN